MCRTQYPLFVNQSSTTEMLTIVVDWYLIGKLRRREIEILCSPLHEVVPNYLSWSSQMTANDASSACQGDLIVVWIARWFTISKQTGEKEEDLVPASFVLFHPSAACFSLVLFYRSFYTMIKLPRPWIAVRLHTSPLTDTCKNKTILTLYIVSSLCMPSTF